MKASFYALMALIALSLSACTTMNPMGAHATVYPVSEQAVVVDSSVPAVEAVVEPTQVAEATPIAEPAFVDPMEALLAQVSEKELTCMAMAIYHEARGESERGQSAVGWVITNRVENGYWGDSVCKVVYSRNPRGCQFSWVCDGKSDIARDMNSYKRARDIALRVMVRQLPNPVGRSLYFDGYVHGTRRKPGQMQIGAHRFYADYSNRPVSKRKKRG